MSDAPAEEPKALDKDAAQPATKDEKDQDKAAQDLGSQKGDKKTMEIKVGSPFTTYFTGQAFSISGVNATGPFDILPGHHNFISLLEPCTLVIRAEAGNEQKVNINGGLIHVKADKVTVFLDI